MVVDSADRPVAVIEVTSVRVVELKDVDLSHAMAKGDGTLVVLARFRLIAALGRS